MTITIRSFIDLAKTYCEVFAEQGISIQFETAMESQYITNTVNRYNQYKASYMKPDVQFLDRHKVAAILVVQGLSSGIIRSNLKPSETEIDIAPQKVLLLCAFDYIVAQTNRIIEEKNPALKKLDEFIFPQAWSCKTTYIDILSRNLYYAERDFMLNEMDLAEKFFLLEHICLTSLSGGNAQPYFDALREFQEH